MVGWINTPLLGVCEWTWYLVCENESLAAMGHLQNHETWDASSSGTKCYTSEIGELMGTIGNLSKMIPIDFYFKNICSFSCIHSKIKDDYSLIAFDKFLVIISRQYVINILR